jgi:hypothetical protein
MQQLGQTNNKQHETTTENNHTKRAKVQALEEILYKSFPVLDHGFARVIDSMGDDSAIVINYIRAIPGVERVSSRLSARRNCYDIVCTCASCLDVTRDIYIIACCSFSNLVWKAQMSFLMALAAAPSLR